MLKDSELTGFVDELTKEVMSKKYEEIKFENKDSTRSYLVRAPINPPFTTAVHFEVSEGESTDKTLMLLSTDMEQVNMLFGALRTNDRKVIAAFDWAYTERKKYPTAAFVLGYDFANTCPTIEIVMEQWTKDYGY